MLNVGGFRGAYLVKHRRCDDGIDIVDIDITGDIIDIDIDIVDNNPIDIGPHHHGCHDYDDIGAGCDDSAAGTSGRDTDHRAPSAKAATLTTARDQERVCSVMLVF